MSDILKTFRNRLKSIVSDKNEDILERRVADFYLNILKPYDDRSLKRQRGFGRGIGGTGDNIVSMPVVERNERGIITDSSGQLQTVHCVFDDFQSYLNHIEKRLPVKKTISRWKFLPSSVNGLTADEYYAIWERGQGLDRD